jgi:D-3-phosphoglycerate dehydrogenase
MKVLVTDPISPKGIDVLRQSNALKVVELGGISEQELINKISDADALIVRSQTRVSAGVIIAARKLRVIGRAGVGVDNVDVDAATQHGIVVLNTPGSNSLSAAEHTISLMMALARNIPQAHASMRAGQWDRKSFQGVELFEKTLGVIGMGRIGTEVARRAVGLGMRVIAFDPLLAHGRAAALQVEPVDLPTLYAQSDFITIHIPLTNETRGMIGKKQFAQMKRGVRLVNCARGGIINEQDLADAIKSGQVAGAALDVFEQEPPPVDFPLRQLDAVVMTPHLGAATAEAQERVGIEIAQAVFDFLTTGTIRNAVNAANLDVKTVEALRPYLQLGEKLGTLVAQLASGKITRLHIAYFGKASELQFNPITRAALKGFLESYLSAPFTGARLDAAVKPATTIINEINAPAIAEQLGIHLEESKVAQSADYTEMISLEAIGSGGTGGDARVIHSAAATFLGSPNNPRIVRINEMFVEAQPSGVLLTFVNKDRPGIVGEIGTLLGRHNVNIASMSLSRNTIGGEALTVINLDSVPPPAALQAIKNKPDIRDVKIVVL